MTKILSQSEVAAIRERAAKATPGWRARDLGNGSFAIDMSADGCRNGVWREGMTSHFNIVEGAGQPNAVFAAAARTDVPALCDTIDALRAKLEVAMAELQGIVEYWNGAPESAVDAIETVADRAHSCLAHLNTLAASALGTKEGE